MNKFTTLLFTLLISAGAMAEDNMTEPTDEMTEATKVCSACHGEDGIAIIDNIPNLKGQKKGYFITSIKAYQKRQRTGGLAGLMHQISDGLSDEDIARLADYYATMQ